MASRTSRSLISTDTFYVIPPRTLLWFAEVDDADDEGTSFAGVHDKDTSFAGVPVPNTTVVTNADDN